MTVTTGVSFLGQSISQTNRLRDMNISLQNLQRQITTQKKHENLSGFGAESDRVLRLRGEKQQLETYNQNVDRALTRLTLMNDSLNSISTSIEEIKNALRLQPEGENFDIADIQVQSQQALEYVATLINVEFDGRYLFAGTDANTAPFADLAGVTTTTALEVTNWLNGTNNTTQFLNNINTLDNPSPTGLGFSSSLSSASNVSVQIDTSLELNYGVLAHESGLNDAVRALATLSSLQMPDPATDVPVTADFMSVIDDIISTIDTARNNIENAQASVASKVNLAVNVQEQNQVDINTLTTLIDEEENVDTTEAIVLLQSLQTQMTASYEVTQLVSRLSLVNFL